MSEEEMEKIGLASETTLLSRFKEGLKKHPRNYTNFTRSKSVDKLKKTSIDPLMGLGHQIGSNNWAVSGKHTKSGKPLLASDPHLKNSIPSMWHVMHLDFPWKGENVTLVGGTIPGLPFVIIG
jgi:acyl-homoserine lactone acylase PvdQ